MHNVALCQSQLPAYNIQRDKRGNAKASAAPATSNMASASQCVAGRSTGPDRRLLLVEVHSSVPHATTRLQAWRKSVVQQSIEMELVSVRVTWA